MNDSSPQMTDDDLLPIYVLYDHPRDMPDHFVVRAERPDHRSTRGGRRRRVRGEREGEQGGEHDA
jgi:hypothetical protein